MDTNWNNISELVIYKNNQLIAFNKPAGLPVQPDQTGDTSLLELAQSYTKSNLHLIHRIDRPASGVVLMAKNNRALTHLSRQFSERTIEKTYLAIVKKGLPAQEATLTHHLLKSSKAKKAIAFDESTPRTKEGILHYKIIGSGDRYDLLNIQLTTGRFHQIRAQLAATGFPIKGDVKYGFRRSHPDRSISLHAWKLKFVHPVTNESTLLIAPLPENGIWHSLAPNNLS